MLTGRCKKLPLSGELANAVSLRGFVSRSGAANAAFRYDPSCEKAILENPQIFQNCEIINILSADYAQSKCGAHFKSSHPLIFIISLLTTNLILP